jgi:hypothetical protein
MMIAVPIGIIIGGGPLAIGSFAALVELIGQLVDREPGVDWGNVVFAFALATPIGWILKRGQEFLNKPIPFGLS